MSLGHRTFLVEGDEIKKMSQRKFDAVFFRHEKSLPEYAGQTLTFATVIYELVNRNPLRICSLSCHKLRIKADGSMDEKNFVDGVALQLNAPSQSRVSRAGPLIDAKELFDSRRLQQLNPKLSGPAHKKILQALFG
jgi:hypothetical protein